MAKHSRKSILAIILTLCTALCLGIFAACNDDDGNTTPTDQPVTYTVTIMQDANTPAEGVRVTVGKGSATFAPKTTDADGKVTFELVPDDYQIALAETSLPDHYEAPAGLALTKTNQDVTITLVRKPVYKVTLVNPDGTPYYEEDVLVGICDDTGCRNPVNINNQGVAEIEETTGDYHVQIQGLPENRAYSWVLSDVGDTKYYRTVEGGYEFLAEEGNREMTIVIYPVNIIESIAEMTDAEKQAYQQDNWDVYFKSGSTAYKVNATIPANTTVYYSVTPEYSNKYELIGIGNSSTITWLCYGTSFNNNGYQYFPVMEAGKTNYFGITNTDTESEAQVEFVIEAPAASYHEVTSVQNVNVRIDNEEAYAVIEFKPTAAAAYQVIVQGEQTAIEQLDETELANYFGYYGDYEENAECTVRYASDMIGKTVYLVVHVKPDGEYPATATVEFVKANDLKDTTTDVEVEATLTQFADNEDATKSLIPVDLDGTDELYYDEENDCYHLNDENGPIIVVMLTGELDFDRIYLGSKLVYLEMETNGQIAPYVFDVTTEADKEDTTKGNSYADYRKMLRGFKEYTLTPDGQDYILSIPEELEEEYCYANYVNSDGVYPLTKELQEYLELFAKYAANYKENNLGSELIPDGADYQPSWMFACYYYGIEVVLEDDIIGEYETEDGDTLIVKANGKYEMTVLNDGATYNGRWSKVDSEDEEIELYLFKEVSMWNSLYDVERKEDGTLEFYYNENYEGYEYLENPAAVVFTFTVPKDKIIGDYETEDGITLTVNEDGTYTMTISEDEVYEGNWSKDEDADTYTFAETSDFMPQTYTVYFNEGTLDFFSDPDASTPDYTFGATSEDDDKEPEYTLYTEDEGAMLKLYEDGTYKFYLYNGRTGEFMLLITGDYSMSDEGSITIDRFKDEEGMGYDSVTASYDSASGKVTVTIVQDGGEPQEFKFNMNE